MSAALTLPHQEATDKVGLISWCYYSTGQNIIKRLLIDDLLGFDYSASVERETCTLRALQSMYCFLIQVWLIRGREVI